MSRVNIIKYFENVKLDELSNTEITDISLALAQQVLYADSDNDEAFEKRWLNEKVWYYGIKDIESEHCQNRCRHSIKPELAITPQAKEKKPRHYIPPEQKFPFIKMCSEQGLQPIYFARGIAQNLLDCFRYMSIQKDGQTFFIQQNQKGAERYQKKVMWDIIDFCKSAEMQYKNCVFCTLTMKQRQFEGHFADAWKPFAEEVKKFFDKLRHEFKCDYVWVKESTLKGFPHIHALIYHNEEFTHTFHPKKKKKKSYFIDGGDLFKIMSRIWTFGFFEMDINRRKSTVNYLVKYIAKSAKAQFKNLTKKGKVKKDDVKDLLTVCMPIYSKTRGYGMSQLEIAPEVKAAREEKIASLERAKAEASEKAEKEFVKSSAAREAGRAYLKTLSNKSDISCTRKIGLYSNSTLESEFSGIAERANDFSEERKALVHKKYAKSVCNGCVLTQLVDFYTGKNDSLFKPACNLDLLVGIIDNANIQIDNIQWVFGETWSDAKKFFFYVDAFIKELGLRGTPNDIVRYIQVLFYTNPMLWWLYLPKDISSQFYKLRLQIDHKAVERYKRSPYYTKLINMFEDFFLTYSANGAIIK